MKEKRFTTKRLTVLAVVTALGLITFLIECLFPPLFIPGAKMGLSNIFSLAALIILGPAEALIVVAARTLLGCFFTGFSALMYSLPAGVIAVSLEAVLLYTLHPKISLIAVSVIGAVTHNIVQNIIFALVTQSAAVLSYSPYLALIGAVSGLIVGLTVYFIVKKVPKSQFGRLLGEAQTHT